MTMTLATVALVAAAGFILGQMLAQVLGYAWYHLITKGRER